MFLKGVEQRGHRIVLTPDKYDPAVLVVDEEILGFRIHEKRNRVHLTDQGNRSYPSTELVPSGVMRLTVYEPPLKGYHKSKIWEDGPKKGKVEDQMQAVFDGLIVLTGAIKQYRAYLEDLWRKQAVAREIEKRKEEERREEEARRKQLREDAQLWEECRRVQAYINAVEQVAREQGQVVGPDSEIGRWMTWAQEYVDSIHYNTLIGVGWAEY